MQIATAQLSVLDGSLQEMPETLAVLEQGATRGTLYLCVDLIGDSPDREALARQMLQAANREYGGSRGSITLALTQAVRAVNELSYNQNLNRPRELRCIAGITAAVLRGDDLYIAQGGPGLVCHVRGTMLTRHPAVSPWFVPDQPIGDFPTPGAVPIGLRIDYTPDLSYVKLMEGDSVLIATRALAHLFNDEELIDAVADHSVPIIIDNIEDIAGSSDLSVIAIQCASPAAEQAPIPEPSILEAAEPRSPQWQALLDRFSHLPEPSSTLPETPEEEETENFVEEPVAPPAPTAEELEAIRLREERRRERRARINASILGAASGAMRGIAGVASRVDLHPLGNAFDRGMASLFWTTARLIRAIVPGGPGEKTGASRHPKIESAWRIAALVFPLVMIAFGVGAQIQYQREQDRDRALQFAQLLDQTSSELKKAEALAKTDKAAARDFARQALKLADQARALDPTSAPVRSILLQAQDMLDQIDGVASLIYVPKFAVYTDAKSKPTRIVLHLPDIFVLDRGAGRIYRYHIDDAGASVQPVSGDGTIIKVGDKIGDRAVGELIDIMWIEAGRLVALDRNGTFWQYDSKGTWSARVATDGNKWTRVNAGANSSNNLYLLDPSSSQVLKYAQTADTWSSSTPYLSAGVTADLTSTVDMAVDTEVWLLQNEGKVLRFNQGRAVDFGFRDLDTPLTNPVAISTSSASVYIADAGNQRIVQFDRATGKFLRQFKPDRTYRETFSALKTLAVDEASRKFFLISGSTAYFANIPQQ